MIREAPLYALIPARGGSKGIVGKNLRKVAGKTLLAHAIEAATQVNEIDEIYVSSDDPQILLEASELKAIPHKRDAAAGSDLATATDVLRDFVDSISPEVLRLDPFIIYLQPTSPLRTATNISESLRLIESNDHSIVLSVNNAPVRIEKLLKLDDNGLLVSESKASQASANRQMLTSMYFQPNGAIYIFRISDFKKNGIFPLQDSIPYFMSAIQSVDVDIEDDLVIAERLMGI